MKDLKIMLCLWLGMPGWLFAQSVPNNSSLEISQIMQGERFVGYLPQNVYWSVDGKFIYFSWNPNQDTLRSLYKVDPNGGSPQKVSTEEQKSLPSRFGDRWEDQYVYAKNGDLFLMNLKTGQQQQITNTLARENNPQFTADGQAIVFNQSNNLFLWKISDGSLTQLSNFQSGNARRESSPRGYKKWLEDDQMAYFEILRKRNREAALRQAQNEALAVKRPRAIYLGDKRVSNLELSPDRRYITYRLSKSPRSERTKVPNYVTESGFVEELNARAKVGSPQPTYESWIFDLQRDSAYQIQVEQIEGIYDKPTFLKDYHQGEEAYEEKYPSVREVIFHGPYYSADNQAFVVIRSQDNKDRWIMGLDLETAELKLYDRQRDEAWVGGPGISSWNFSGGNVGWMPDNRHIWFQSEESGFSHLYTYQVASGQKKALTEGDFEIISAQISQDNKYFYITSNRENPHEQHFYCLSIKGGKMTKITDKVGKHEVALSPDESQLAIRYSFSNQPWELFVMPNKAGEPWKQLTESTTEDFKKYAWRAPEIIRFKAEDGVQVPARLYQPTADKKNGAAVIFVHGAGYLQNVHRWWSSYYREFMFHNLLVDNGYTVLDIDYRASNGYGRDWRTGIYRFMGGKDLSDQVDGAKYLVEELGIDADRVGIYGGSYGGFITLMALFTEPGTFKCGAALRSVTDWAHYNHGYTSNILNTPVEDSIAYYKSSPIYHTDGLQDHLLILHGMIDTNVQFQDVVRMAQRLIESGKDNWEFAVFPLERHGFVEASSWTDEYKRIFKLFQTHLAE